MSCRAALPTNGGNVVYRDIAKLAETGSCGTEPVPSLSFSLPGMSIAPAEDLFCTKILLAPGSRSGVECAPQNERLTYAAHRGEDRRLVMEEIVLALVPRTALTESSARSNTATNAPIGAGGWS
jgi:hypothetical protein